MHENRLPQCEEKFKALDREMVDVKKPKGNGINLFWKSVGIFLVVMGSTIGYIVANDAASRDRDAIIEKEHTKDLSEIKENYNAAILKQTETNGKIFAKMTEIETLLRVGNINTAGSRTDATARYEASEKRKNTGNL